MHEIFINSPVDEAPGPNEIGFRFLIWTLELIEKPDVRRLLIEAISVPVRDD